MMRDIKKVTDEFYKVTSEPGDATRYEYLVYRESKDDFTFAPTGSTFLFPQRMNIKDVAEGKAAANSAAVKSIAKRYHCNSCTVLECYKAIKEIYGYSYMEAKR